MIVSVMFLLLIYYGEAHITCDNPITNISLTMVSGTGYSNNRTKRAAQSLRISTYYDPSFTSLSNKEDIISLVINPAIQFWQDALQVKYPLSSPLLIDRDCPLGYHLVKNGADKVKVCISYCSDSVCDTTTIPSRYMKKCYTGNSVRYTESGSEGSGAENTDLLILIKQISTSCTSTTLAYASACELEHGHDRPVLGVLNICPGKIDTVNGVKEAVAVLKHEIAHILGVASTLFGFYRDECDNPRTLRDANGYPSLGMKTIGASSIYQYSDSTVLDTVITYKYRTGLVPTQISFMVTPTVRNEVRKYFNCPTLEGLMLENYGGSGSSLSHFEKLYFKNELMTATISDRPGVSRFTLAVLQDTGWYYVNFDKAEYVYLGADMGCDIVTKNCFEFINSRTSGISLFPYCNQINSLISSAPQCGSDKKIFAYCDLYYNPTLAATIPAQFKYFSNDLNVVSTDPYSDYCPMVMDRFCNSNSSNIEPYCNNYDRPCTGVFIGTCPTITSPAYTATSPAYQVSTTCIPIFLFRTCTSAHVSMPSYKMAAFFCSIIILINDYIL